jgi:hypothetical protein
MTTPRVAHLAEEDLDDETLTEAQACRQWLRAARFGSKGDFEICNDPGINQQTTGFVTMYAPQVKVHLFSYELYTLLILPLKLDRY